MVVTVNFSSSSPYDLSRPCPDFATTMSPRFDAFRKLHINLSSNSLFVLISASPGDPGRQLPTVSSRYHSPSLKRSRGRHTDETIMSDEEVQKAKLIKKSFTSPEQKQSSPKSSPKLSPKSSPKICSPKSRSGILWIDD